VLQLLSVTLAAVSAGQLYWRCVVWHQLLRWSSNAVDVRLPCTHAGLLRMGGSLLLAFDMWEAVDSGVLHPACSGG
jgi:hypothetical protein